MKQLFVPLCIAVLSLFSFSINAQIDQTIKIPPQQKDILKKGKIKNPKLFLTKDIALLHFSINMRSASRRGSGNNVVYSAPFKITLMNKGMASTGMFYLSTYVNDYSHPHSGDGWWARETNITEMVRLPVARGKGVSRKGFNTIQIANLKGGEKIVITGRLDIRGKFVNHYHITAAADSNKGATSYYTSHGRVTETDEYNNKKGVIPRR